MVLQEGIFMKKISKAHVIKLTIIALALINLIALFVFDYKLPDFFKFGKDSADVNSQIADSTEEPAYKISFDTDTITYNGTAALDLMSGVTVTDASGNVSDVEVFANIVTADYIDEKEIVYSINTDSGQVTATRKLKLENYSGPSLVIPETLPQVSEEELDKMISLMPADETFHARDGFGKDITAQIVASYTIDPNDPRVVHYIFSITNIFNDKISIPADITINSDRPILVLKQNEVTVSKGTAFQPLDYIERAESQQGADLIHTIEVSGNVDMNTPGKYTLTYTITGDTGVQSIPQKLNVTVE